MKRVLEPSTTAWVMKRFFCAVTCVVAGLCLVGCAATTRDTKEPSALRFNWNTSTELAKFRGGMATAGSTLNITPIVHELPPPSDPYGGINFSGVVVFDLVIDAGGNVLAAFPKEVDGMCSCRLESLVEHRIKPLIAALLKWKFSAPNPAHRDEIFVLELPIDFQESKRRDSHKGP